MDRLLSSLLAVAMVVAAAPAAADSEIQPAERFGRSEADLAIERFLLEAEVVGAKTLGEGITRPRKLTLRQGRIEDHAVFKTIDVEDNEVVRNTHIEMGFEDRWRFEVAAYRLDRWLGLNLVPVTVQRIIDGEVGSLQIWVRGVTTLRSAMQADPNASGDLQLLARRLTQMFLFDNLIGNVDRTWDNILVAPGNGAFLLIDHSRSFRLTCRVPPIEKAGEMLAPLSPDVRSRLEALDEHFLVRLTGDLLRRAQRKALLARRDRLVEELDRRGLLS